LRSCLISTLDLDWSDQDLRYCVIQGKSLSDCAEEGLVELYPPSASPGELMMACRHGGKMSPAQCGAVGWNASMHCRVEAFSLDGGRKWGNFTPVQSLPDTPVKSGVARWEARRALLFSSPDVTRDPCPRHCMNDYGRCDTTRGKDCVGQRNYLTVFASVDNVRSQAICLDRSSAGLSGEFLLDQSSAGLSGTYFDRLLVISGQDLAVQKASLGVGVP